MEYIVPIIVIAVFVAFIYCRAMQKRDQVNGNGASGVDPVPTPEQIREYLQNLENANASKDAE